MQIYWLSTAYLYNLISTDTPGILKYRRPFSSSFSVLYTTNFYQECIFKLKKIDYLLYMVKELNLILKKNNIIYLGINTYSFVRQNVSNAEE